jgi:phospholipid:diacylglycerol acyltransferase
MSSKDQGREIRKSGKQLRQKKPRSSNSKRGQSTRDKMLTHLAADGGLRVIHEKTTEDSPGGLMHEDTADDDSLDNSKLPRLKKRYMFLFALVVFFGQIAVSVTLKRYGWIEKDFNELVAEQVLPRFQEQFETGSLTWTAFNDSLYWLRINQSLGYSTQELLRPGFHLKEKGAEGKYPIIMVPGFVTTGLEVWDGKQCAKNYFRQKMWGGVGSVQHWLMERHCVLEHLSLDPITGKDPEGIRIRAALGFEGADYFMGNYWVWGKILENLADIGYDGSMMSIESYDWRLAFPKLEERDGYLTKLKYKIEAFHKASGKKVVLTSHSMGALLVHYFFTWVTTSERAGGGGGGKDWADKHIHAYVNIAGSQLGVPKAASALLSGEMSDTIILGTAGHLIEQFIGRKLRRDLWMSWGSLWSMLPAAGDRLWDIGADFKERLTPDDAGDIKEPTSDAGDVFGELDDIAKTHLMVMTDQEDGLNSTESLMCTREDLIDEETETIVNQKIREFSSRKGAKTREVVDFLTTWGGGLGPATAGANDHSFDPNCKESKKTWHDLSRTPLPHAPNMKVYCLYGVGLDTERSYFYKRNTGDTAADSQSSVFTSAQGADTPFILDTSVQDPENGITHGVKYSDGDASVPLLSLGYMCADAWRRKDSGLNPSMAKVVTREYKHKQEFMVDDPMRGGPHAADHVDILGNFNMMEDFLKIVSDYETETVDDRFESDIIEISKKVNAHPDGGLFKRKRRR